MAFAVQQKVAQLRRLVADGVAKEKKDLFMLAGGDQIAESLANVGKRELRRYKGPAWVEASLESSRDFSRKGMRSMRGATRCFQKNTVANLRPKDRKE